MSNLSTGKASERIAGLLDAQSFVEIGSCVTARSTDFNLPEKKTPGRRRDYRIRHDRR